MRWVKWVFALLFVITAVVVFSTNIFQKKYTYYYYPEWNAYYDVRQKNYIYSIDGGKTWDTITNSSNTVTNTLGEKIVLHSRSTEIWMENDQHRSHYGGRSNDLVGNFLETGEEKRKYSKKHFVKDSSNLTPYTTDSVIKDSSKDIDDWVNETPIQENIPKEKKSTKEDEENESETDLKEPEPAIDSLEINTN